MWAQLINAALGIWLMAAPAVLGFGNPAQACDRIVGPIAATFAIVACWGATRVVGRANVVLGLWLLLAPWVLGYASTAATVNSLLVGVPLAGLALVRGQVKHQFDGGWSMLWHGSSPRSGNEREEPI